MRAFFLISWMFLCLFLLGSCTTSQYRASADKEVYKLIKQESVAVPGMDAAFSIDPVPFSVDDLPAIEPTEDMEFLGEVKETEAVSRVLTLEKALELAVKRSRDYQSRKESVYLEALSFTETRQKYRPVFSGSATGVYTAKAIDKTKLSDRAAVVAAAPDLIEAIGGLTGAPADILSAYADLVESSATLVGANAPTTVIEQERSESGTTTFSVSMLTRGGAAIAAGLTTNFLRFLTGDPRVSATSALLASIDIPLLGSERRIAAETLTQEERNLLYSLRSFSRYRQSFSVDIADNYYRVLQSRDAVRNNWLGYQAFLKDLERARAMAETGRITKTELGRNEEEALQSRNNWIRSLQSYQQALDRFKIRLGLPTDTTVVLDDQELEKLMEAGLATEPDFTDEDAIQVSLAARLDYYTERDKAEDAERKLKLAKDALMPDISLGLDASAASKDNQPLDIDVEHYTWSAGLNVNPKFNRKPVRNQFRRSLIQYEAAQRGLIEFEDNVKLDVRQAWRDLEQSRISYEIQKNSVEVSERRVLHQRLLFEAGRGNALDQIDAQNALIGAKNQLSAALVDHKIANLRLWLGMGILYIKENGQWENVTDVETNPES